LLICNKDLLAPTLKRLSMFVLRAQAKLSDASADFVLYGLAGDAVQGSASPAWALHSTEKASYINLYPAQGVARQLCLTTADAPVPPGSALSAGVWLWGDVMSGVATLSAKVTESFVPQMLNYESIGGVNFKKGCYPGQEVVARSQFRGTLKRRAFLLHSNVEITAGDAILGGANASDVGTVVQVAASPQGGFDAIAVLQLHALQDGSLQAGGATPGPLTLLTLPYALLEEV
jgi:folate-binding protein YgfZ